VIQVSEQQVIDDLADRLVDAYPRIEPALVAKVVTAAYARFDASPIREFIPLLVERSARTELARLDL
jgi:hypothetical protein